MLVGNKHDESPVHLSVNSLKEEYPNIIDKTYYPISCTRTDEFFNKLYENFEDVLVRELKKIDTHQIKISSNEFLLLEKIRQSSIEKSIITHTEFDEIYTQCEIVEKDLNKEDFLKLLDCLGEIIYFTDFDWLDIYILDPHWLTYSIYNLLSYNDFGENEGQFNTDDTIRILSDSITDDNNKKFNYTKNNCRLIVDALLHYELAYRLNADEYIIPDKLPLEKPNEVRKYTAINGEKVLNFEFKFKGFLPNSVIPNLIFTQSKEIKKCKNTGKQLVWREGVILESTNMNSTACLQVNYREHTLNLYVEKKGEFRGYLHILRDIILKILKPLEKKLPYEEYVILPKSALSKLGSGVSSKESIDKATYKRILSKVSRGEKTITSDNGDEYDLEKIMGFIINENQVNHIEQHTHHYYNISIQNADTSQLIYELKEGLSDLSAYVRNNYNLDTKDRIFNELNNINKMLNHKTHISSIEKSKLSKYLNDFKNKTSKTMQLLKDVKEIQETIYWVLDTFEKLLNRLS